MAQRFVTLYPVAKNTHLIKDIGQIPHFMNQQFGYCAQLVCYRNDDDYPNLKSEATGVEMVFLEFSGKRMFLENAFVRYIEENAKDIDVLNLYHLDRDTFYYGNLYKKINPDGLLYCKLDLYNEFVEHGKKRHSINVFKNWVFRRWEKMFIRHTDLFSVENWAGLELMKKRYPALADDIMYLPNGINSSFVDGLFETPTEKEPLILILSRIGDVIKNHEILLRVLPHLNLKNWRIVFAGPVVQRFMPKVDAFFQEFPHLREKVQFTGEITDRKVVYDWLRRSRVNVLTSRHESFGIVFAEALYFGNYLVGTDGMSSFNDLTCNGEFGERLPFNDDSALRKCLQSLIDDPDRIDALRKPASKFARQNFVWPVLVERLEEELQMRRRD